MKTNTLLLLASLAVLATNASAASSQPEPVVLPVYVVQAPRYLPAELQINASLDELRQQAHAPAFICPELAVLQAPVKQSPKLVLAAMDATAVRVAKS